jgi:hypothetical protein
MIAQIGDPPLTGFGGAINYNEKKIDKELGTLIYNNVGTVNNHEFRQAFEDVCSQKPNLKYIGDHISINFNHGENLPDNKLLEITQAYIERMGYGDTPLLLYKHEDKDHPHLHLIISRVSFDGDVYKDSFSRVRSQQISRELEKEFDLIETVYYKFDNKSLNEVNSRKYHFQSALKKSLKSYATKAEIETLLQKEEIQYIFKNNLTNADIENVVGSERYNKIGGLLEKNHFFKKLFKDELLSRLDYLYDLSNNKDEFLSKVEKSGLYVRHLTDKGISYYKYGIQTGDKKTYFKDGNLPLKYRYSELPTTFKELPTNRYILASEQKHIIYNRAFVAFDNSSRFSDFYKELDKIGITANEGKDSKGNYSLFFTLKDIDNPVTFKSSDINEKLNSGTLFNHFMKQEKAMSETIIRDIKVIDDTFYPVDGFTRDTQPHTFNDNEYDKMINKRKRRRVGDRGRTK